MILHKMCERNFCLFFLIRFYLVFQGAYASIDVILGGVRFSECEFRRSTYAFSN